MTDREKIDEAVGVAIQYGQIDGAHHRVWVIDQMLRLLLGEKYDAVIAEANDGEDGPNTYEWDVGIPP